MEQARYWMLSKRGHDKYLDDSWEEKAFAEDAAGMLGGCVWPPRSYTCSFCRREFRSAQALGGHMNVHRRDRARLKQFSCFTNDQIINPAQNDSYHNDLYSSLITTTYPTQHKRYYTSVSDNPNSEPPHPTVITIPRKISTLVTQESDIGSGSKQILGPYLPSNYFMLNHKTNPSLSSSNNTKLGSEKKELHFKTDNHHEKTSLAISLIFQEKHPTMFADHDEDAPNNHSKRRKTHMSSQAVISPEVGQHKVDDELSRKVHGLQSNSTEELDLELRLGSLPKVQHKFPNVHCA